jgi:hypothetical protein
MNTCRYDAFQLRRALERDLPKFRWCVGRYCSFGEEHPEDSSPVIGCSACGVLACLHHNIAWHHGETCPEYDRRVAATQARAEYKSEKEIKRVAKRCPGCRRFINKNRGCNHMTCKLCSPLTDSAYLPSLRLILGVRLVWKTVLLDLFT